MKVKSLSRVRLFATPWTAAYQAPPSMGFSGQEYWSGVPSPSPINYLGGILLVLEDLCADGDIQSIFIPMPYLEMGSSGLAFGCTVEYLAVL